MAIGPQIKGLFLLDDGAPVPFLYNPDEVREGRTVEWAKKRGFGMSHPRSQYVGGNDREISFTMWLNDPFRWNGVATRVPLEPYIETFFDLTHPIHRGGILTSAPPTVTLILGATVRRVKIASLEVMHRQWNELLVLRKATIAITLFEVVDVSKNRVNSLQTFAGAV